MTLEDRLEAESASIACAARASATTHYPLGSPAWRYKAERGLDEYKLTGAQRRYAVELFDTFVADGFVPHG